jgi:hypothetical protein
MRLTLSDHTGVLVTHHRTDTTASIFDEWLRHLASVAEHLGLIRPGHRDETEDERIDRALGLLRSEVEESGAVSSEISWRCLQKWGIALPWLPPGLLPKIVKDRGRAWVVIHSSDLSTEAWLLGVLAAGLAPRTPEPLIDSADSRWTDLTVNRSKRFKLRRSAVAWFRRNTGGRKPGQ